MFLLQKVVLGITGGIAAYKTAELARIFVRNGVKVQVVMTEAASRFITPLTFTTLTGNPAQLQIFDDRSAGIRHIDLSEGADAMIIAPATANTIAKMVAGLADNLLTTLFIATPCPVIIVPSMNAKMFEHPAVQNNLQVLRSRGCHVLEPNAGELACGEYGRGRMPEPQEIYDFTQMVLTPKDFAGIKAIVTAGPTREHLDPVRYISNPSTGRMGYALARALNERGAQVFLISGPTNLTPPPGVKKVSITSADEMYKEVFKYYEECRLIIKAAAVSDFRPLTEVEQKVKKHDVSLSLELAANRDILKEMGQNKGDRILVGFAAETENAVENAMDKLRNKNLDLIVINDLTEPGAGFAVTTNRVSIIGREGTVDRLPLMEKETVAHEILNRVARLL
ncbi:MAG: bifunctional phosphopantothenoylcysteine decarboxylase/phosphopantothenate--cysteine ligase CoaBC [Bacillota bacterium]|nr:bifunctional phosphopantothenoylcysteine decarboxylase/phosphopantothenate--cysteine ligase CoaBC [Bacillota bacterium]